MFAGVVGQIIGFSTPFQMIAPLILKADTEIIGLASLRDETEQGRLLCGGNLEFLN
jgi:hypothetical protein